MHMCMHVCMHVCMRMHVQTEARPPASSEPRASRESREHTAGRLRLGCALCTNAVSVRAATVSYSTSSACGCAVGFGEGCGLGLSEFFSRKVRQRGGRGFVSIMLPPFRVFLIKDPIPPKMECLASTKPESRSKTVERLASSIHLITTDLG